MRQGPLQMLRRRLLLGKSRTSEPWRWSTSCPGTGATAMTSATCRPSASAAILGSGPLREDDFVFCTLEGRSLALLKKELMFSA